jgi:hypothetical protein
MRKRENIRREQRAKLVERADGRCEMCGFPANNAHHRKNRSQGGEDELSNLLLLCGSGTTECHGWVTHHPAESKRLGLSVWRSDEPEFTPVMYRGHWARLDNVGKVYLLKRGEVRNELGHLHIGLNGSNQILQHGSGQSH